MGSSALSLTLLLMSFIHSELTQDSPKSTLTVTPDNTVFTGERVILTCVIESNQSDWKYEWRRGDTNIQVSQRHTVDRNTLTIEGSESSDEGQYTCGGRIDAYLSSESNSVSLSVKDLPKPQLTVDPESPVFTGETVNLKCVIESYSYWTYEWYKDTDRVKSSDRYTVNTHTLTISGATKSDAGQYTCKGQRHGSPSSSQESNRIDLAVNDLPRSTLTVTPNNTVFTGERVRLKCEIESNRDWRYYWRYEWRKGNSNIQVSQRYTVERNTLTIEGSESSDEGQYTCRGHIEGRSVSSQSSSVSLSVKERPKPVVKVSPDQRVFRGETVTLTCDIQRGGHIQWTYSWFKDGNTHYPYTTTTAEYRFTADVSDSGVYSCRGERSDSQRSHTSAALTLTVSDLPKTKLTVDPKSPVFTGETVNLKCVIESNHTDWRYEWNKRGNNSVKFQSSQRYTLNTDTLTIRAVTTSDEGLYTCRGHMEGRSVSSQESEPINLSVNAASSSRLVTGVVVGSSVCLLFFLSLLLMWRYKKNKDQQRNINQTSVPNQSAQSQLENFPLQSDSDHIYNNGTEVNKRDKDDSEPLTDVTYSEVTVTKKMDKAKAESNNVTYSEVGKRGKKCESKDINPAGPSDLTYAQINIQDKKKTKGKGKSSESGDTLYSELKQNTDRDADAGVGDTTSALAFWKKGQKKINKTSLSSEKTPDD